jgi:hypothetical protein
MGLGFKLTGRSFTFLTVPQGQIDARIMQPPLGIDKLDPPLRGWIIYAALKDRLIRSVKVDG